MRLPLGALLVVRAFELWTHENDIRQAAGWLASVPDPSTLRLMTETRSPAAAARRGPGPPDRSGGRPPSPDRAGRRDLGHDSGTVRAGPAAVSIVTNAVGFCRLVANRITPADLDLHVTGDPACAAGAGGRGQHPRPGLATPRRLPR